MNHRWAACLFLTVSLVLCVAGITQFQSNMEDVFQWLPDQSSERQQYNEFVSKFGSDDFVVISWPTCQIGDPLSDEFSAELRSNEYADLFQDAVSGRDLIRRLQEQSRLRPRDIVERFRGIYYGIDSLQTCVMVSLTPYGMAHRRVVMGEIEQAAQKILGATAEQVVIGGYPQVGAYGDQAIRESIVRSVGPACLLSTLIAWICLRSLRLTVAILMISGLAAALSIAAVTLSGAQWGGLSSVIPTLAYIMSVSGCLHLTNYSRAFVMPNLAKQVLATGWKPCTYSAITTASGMLSLCTSQFVAVREFGVYCATGILSALLCQLILMPVALEWLHREVRIASPYGQYWQHRVLTASLRWDRTIVLTSIMLIVVCGIGLRHLKANLEVERAFRLHSPVMQNIQWLEQNLGPLEQTELVITFPKATSRGLVDRLSLVRAVQQAAESVPAVHRTLSLADSLPAVPSGRGLRSAAARAALQRQLSDRRDELEKSPYLYVGPSEESWRISLRAPFLALTDFAQLEEQVREEVNQEIAQHYVDIDLHIEYTGVSHLYNVAQESVVDDLFRNFTFAFALIVPLMILAVRSISLGLWAMLPNVTPAALVFGCIGISGYEIDIAIAITASVALGIAVDDTTHFLIRFRELGRTQPSSLAALKQAYQQCSAAMLQTTLITSFGLAAFAFGPLAAMTRFAMVLMALVSVALICDLVLLPALLNCLRFVDTKRAQGHTSK